MKTPALLLAASLLFPPLLPAQQPSNSRFDQWDKNKDGQLTLDELPGPLRKNFNRVDKNSDGVISREEDAATGRKRPAGSNQPQRGGRTLEGVERIADLPYADNDNPRQALDLYLPKDRHPDSSGLPLLVFIHGGGWRNGSKEGGGQKIAPFVATGNYAGASIGYRLTDEAHWPSQIEDCKAALRWLRGNAEKYGFDPEKIAVWGTSAGGHLVAMLGVAGGVEDLEGDLGSNDDESSRVTAVIDYFGPTALDKMNDYEDYPSTMNHNAPDSPESLLVGGPILERSVEAASASPMTHVSRDDAAFLIVHGTKDPLVPFPQSAILDEALDKAGVESTLITVEEGGHGKGFPGEELHEIIGRFLDKHLRGKDASIEEKTLPAVAR